MKEDKQTIYTIERIFLGKIHSSELISNIIRKHCNSSYPSTFDCEKTVEKSDNL